MDELIAERDRLKQAVLDWLQSEAEAYRFRFGYQAPMWAEYQKAEDAVENAPAALTAFPSPPQPLGDR